MVTGHLCAQNFRHYHFGPFWTLRSLLKNHCDPSSRHTCILTEPPCPSYIAYSSKSLDISVTDTRSSLFFLLPNVVAHLASSMPILGMRVPVSIDCSRLMSKSKGLFQEPSVSKLTPDWRLPKSIVIRKL